MHSFTLPKNIALVAGFALAFASASSYAQSRLSGTAAIQANWNTAGTWDPASIPGLGDDVIFDYANQGTPTTTSVFLAADQSANSLTFGSTSGTALGAFSLFANSGGSTARALTLTTGNITVHSSVTGVQSMGGSGVITLGASSGTFTINNNSSQQFLLGTSTAFSDAGAAGTTVTYSGTGTGRTAVSGNNTYTGLTTISSGLVSVTSANGLGTTAAGTVVANGASLRVEITGGTINEALTINGFGTTGSNGALSFVSQTAVTELAGAITLGSDSLINFTPAGGGTAAFSFTGGIDNAGFMLNIGNASTTLPITISNTGITGSGGLTVSSGINGLLFLTGPNTYTGKTSLAGLVNIDTIQNAGSTIANSLGAPTIGANSIIDLNGTLKFTGSSAGSSDRGINLIGSSTLNASGDTAFALSGGVSNSFVGSTRTLTLRGTGTGSQGGVIADGAGSATALTKTDAGTWILGGANTFTGATTLSGGTLQLANANALQNSTVTISSANGLAFSTGIGTFNLGSLTGTSNQALTDVGTNGVTLRVGANNAASTTYSGALSGAGGITKTGINTLTLNGTTGGVNTYTGTTRVDGGTIQLGYNAATAANTNIISPGSKVEVAGGTFRMTGRASSVQSQTINSLLADAGASVVNVAGTTGTAGSMTLTTGTISRNVGSTLNFTITQATGGVATVATSSTNNANGLLGSGFTVGGNDWAQVSSGTIAAASYTTQNAVGSWGANQNITNGSLLTGSLGGDLTINSLRLSNNNNVTADLGGRTLAVLNGILVSSVVSAKTETISNGSIQGSSGGDLVVINNGASTTSLNISANVIDNAFATAFTKSGVRLVTLSGTANTYSGDTFVNEGTLAAGAANALGTNSALRMATGATLDITGFNQTVGSLGGVNIDSTGTITLGSATLTTGGGNKSGAFNGVIGGAGNLIKTGEGTQILTGSSSFSGNTTVSAGVLLANNLNGSALGTSVVSVSAGATLGGKGFISGATTVSGSATLRAGTGNVLAETLTLSGNLTLADDSRIQLTLGGSANSNQHSTLARTGGTWVFDANQAFTFSLLSSDPAGNYGNVITGLTGSEAGLATINTWQLLNLPGGYTGTFSFASGNVSLLVIPEPGTFVTLLGGLGVLGYFRRKRSRR